ncbi:Uncharacterised protein [Vibrio cholerae]|nr:Uncharacterised protein [Vibrio cholerae]
MGTKAHWPSLSHSIYKVSIIRPLLGVGWRYSKVPYCVKSAILWR